MNNKRHFRLVGTILLLMLSYVAAFGQTTEFTYQGNLKDGANAANGFYDLEFRIFDGASGGTQAGPVVTRTNVPVTDGSFTVNLDFGSNFPGADRYLEIRVRSAGGPVFTTLDPRQKVGSSPYSLQSLNAATATNATQLGGVAASQFVQSTDPRLTDARPPTAGSTNYVQNTTTLQASTNFNISGNGTAGGTLSGTIVNAGTQYNIGNNRVLRAPGTNNLFAGLAAGTAFTTGSSNSFFGSSAGENNATGSANSFFGSTAGRSNTGSSNSFFGSSAGQANTAGAGNSFFGSLSGVSLSSGSDNSFFGRNTGNGFSTGSRNVLVGVDAGKFLSSGNSNTFVGTNTIGNLNTLDHVTVIGADAFVLGNITSNTVVLGRFEDTVSVPGNLDVDGDQTTTGTINTSAGYHINGGRILGAPGTNNMALGRNSDVAAGGFTFATAIGAGAIATESNSLMLGRSADIVYIPGFLRLSQLGGAGATPLCRNNANTIGTCSSSLRYKTNIGSFSSGLNLIKRLQPITFDWKDGGMHDLGLGAEDVATIEPLLVTYNEKGQVEGVKYDRIGVVLVNAVKEQQAQIEAQKKRIDQQQRQHDRQQQLIDNLKKLVCRTNAQAEVCK